MTTSLEGSRKGKRCEHPLHPSTNPEILVKTGPLDFELPSLESRLEIKIFFNKEKNIGKIYNPFGKFAERAI